MAVLMDGKLPLSVFQQKILSCTSIVQLQEWSSATVFWKTRFKDFPELLSVCSLKQDNTMEPYLLTMNRNVQTNFLLTTFLHPFLTCATCHLRLQLGWRLNLRQLNWSSTNSLSHYLLFHCDMVQFSIIKRHQAKYIGFFWPESLLYVQAVVMN